MALSLFIHCGYIQLMNKRLSKYCDMKNNSHVHMLSSDLGGLKSCVIISNSEQGICQSNVRVV